jgi:sulfur carrier protein ThiS
LDPLKLQAKWPPCERPMNVKVKLFGTLSQRFPGYDLQRGLEVDLPEGARVGDLIALLGFSDRNKPVVAMDSLIRSPRDELSEGAVVNVFQAVYGG